MSDTKNDKTTDTIDELNYLSIKKDAGVAAVLNTILPGLGWIYCEKIWGGIISIITNIGLIYGSLFAFHISSYSYNNYDYRLNFSIIYLIYWIIQIFLVCACVKHPTFDNFNDETESTANNTQNKTTKKRTTTNGRASTEKNWAEQTLVNCSFCNKEFYLLGSDECICPHCGKVHKPE